jgi:uncharacterized protein YjbI with pentapeptide repeats
MGKEGKVGISTGSLEQCQFSLDQLLSQEEHQGDFASYLAKVNQERSELEFDELTGDEIGIKLAFALKNGQLRLHESALNYLEVRDGLLYQGMDPKELSLDMAACDLSDTDLIRVHLWNADLSKANLSKVNLFAADLLEANLTEADLSGATLGKANLSRADLQGANLKWANLGLTNLTKVNFEKANLKGVNLLDSILTAFGANFTGAELGRAELKALNELGQKEGNLLAGTRGLVRDGSGKIIEVESLPDSKPETEEIGEAQNIGDNLANLISAIIALPAEEQEALIKGLKDLEIQPTNE